MSFLGAYLFRFGSSFNGLFEPPYSYLFGFFNIAWIILTIIANPYKISRTSRFSKIIRTHFAIIVLHLFMITAFIVFQKGYFYSRLHLVLTYSFFTTLIFLWRVAFVYLLRIYRTKGFNRRNVVVLGYGKLTQELEKFFRLHPEHGYKFLGYFDNKSDGKKFLGKNEDLIPYCSENNIDEIYCCLPYIKYSQIKKVVDFGEDQLIKVKLIADFRGFSFKGLELQRYDHIPVLNVTSIPLDDLKNKFVKRSFDLAFSFFVIVSILSWLLPIIAILIRLDSKGPVFFRQSRTGKDNNSFTCFKFRTMRMNSEADKKQATHDDPRITFMGSFLRKTSLDELPQFFNVFLGDMSVVGPRPHMLKHTEEYSKVIEKFMARHFVKPGITGLAQAKGYRGETVNIGLMKNRVRFDRFYIENWSLLLDLKIILITIPLMLKGDHKAF